MTLTIELSPAEEARFLDLARQKGADPAALAKELVIEPLIPVAASPPETEAEKDAALALLQSWISAAPTDPAEIREADRSRREFLENLNQNRITTGERPLFP